MLGAEAAREPAMTDVVAPRTEGTAGVDPSPAPRGVPQSVWQRPNGEVETGLRPARIVEALKEGGALWVDIDSGDLAQHALLEKMFGFHPLAIEDTLSPKTRVKIEEYGPYLFMVVRSVRLDHRTYFSRLPRW
jgi:magnesium transporter